MMLILAKPSLKHGHLILAGHDFNLDYPSPVMIDCIGQDTLPKILYDRDSAKIAERQDALLPNAVKIHFPRFQKIKIYFPRFQKIKNYFTRGIEFRPRIFSMQMQDARHYEYQPARMCGVISWTWLQT